MKNLIIAALLSVTFASLSLAYSYPAGWNPEAPCGWEFNKSHEEQVPLTYCWAKQDRGNQTYNGFLGVACSGSACKAANNVHNQ